jgi:hypothetical protein
VIIFQWLNKKLVLANYRITKQNKNHILKQHGCSSSKKSQGCFFNFFRSELWFDLARQGCKGNLLRVQWPLSSFKYFICQCGPSIQIKRQDWPKLFKVHTLCKINNSSTLVVLWLMISGSATFGLIYYIARGSERNWVLPGIQHASFIILW